MDETTYIDILRRILKERPNEAFITGDGDAIALLRHPLSDEVLLIKAPPGVNLHRMSEDEINSYIVNALT